MDQMRNWATILQDHIDKLTLTAEKTKKLQNESKNCENSIQNLTPLTKNLTPSTKNLTRSLRLLVYITNFNIYNNSKSIPFSSFSKVWLA